MNNLFRRTITTCFLALLISAGAVMSDPAWASDFDAVARLRLRSGAFFVEAETPTWMQTRPPVMAGVRLGGWEFAYGKLWSDVFNSDGERIVIDYRRSLGPTVFARVEADHYRRGNEGGGTIASGLEFYPCRDLTLRVALAEGWTTGRIQPQLTLRWEPRL